VIDARCSVQVLAFVPSIYAVSSTTSVEKNDETRLMLRDAPASSCTSWSRRYPSSANASVRPVKGRCALGVFYSDMGTMRGVLVASVARQIAIE
jgi:hypothetical protein